MAKREIAFYTEKQKKLPIFMALLTSCIINDFIIEHKCLNNELHIYCAE